MVWSGPALTVKVVLATSGGRLSDAPEIRAGNTAVGCAVLARAVSHRRRSVVDGREVADNYPIRLAGAAIVGGTIAVRHCWQAVARHTSRASRATDSRGPTEAARRIEARSRPGRIVAGAANDAVKLRIAHDKRPSVCLVAASPVRPTPSLCWPCPIMRCQVVPSIGRHRRSVGQTIASSQENHDCHPPTRAPQP